ncbi:unnamed protein product [Polarella glacialis]|uniref:Uncharacterized protein n=1 Tax=Polarella glacialis TaxID=89957 RepID=A0A813FD73_POLGL|nr:unnamed protein product [Polarella glacialis]
MLDLANHAGAESANARLLWVSGAPSLEAVAAIPEGHEVCWCYGPKADYLDLWERYGFFDATACIHSAEIWAGAVGEEPCWIPEKIVPLECPLLTRLLAEARAECEENGADGARRSGLTKFAVLIRRHLSGYPALAPDGTENGSEDVRAVLQYEQQLLAGTLANVEKQLNR